MEKRKIVLTVVVIVILVFAYFISKSNNSSQLTEEYKPSTEYETLAYNAFIERFGDIENIQVTGMSTSETSYDEIKNNLYEEYDVNKEIKNMKVIKESDYTKFLNVEVEFVLDENTGNLMAGDNTHSYYLGLNKEGQYVVVGESLLG